ncbi:MAG: group 1 truncated hemoglobin [Pseudomonadota bacterium]
MLLAACAVDPLKAPSLHDRLGGSARIAGVVDRTIDRSAADPRTKRSFDGIKLKAVKDSLTQQLCAIGGGGCRYEGATMADAHKDARIRAAEFDALVTILREELDRAGTDPAAKNELLRLLAPMKRDIVVEAQSR